ncbi:MAG: 50S ribosomal protein L24 [Clostridiales bacterium]|nr:50S ribosomal protein L24 [Clostridiales bacterium]
MNSLSVKKGDTVVVLAGKDKGKTGSVLAVSPKTNRVIVSNVNIVKKHKKARNTQQKSEIVSMEAPINASNVMVMCAACNDATRIAKKEVDGKMVRVCKKCGAILEANKKAAKKATKESKKEVASEKTTKTKKTTTKKATADKE